MLRLSAASWRPHGKPAPAPPEPPAVQHQLDHLEREFGTALASAGLDTQAIESVRIRFLGRKGELTALMKGLGKLFGREAVVLEALN